MPQCWSIYGISSRNIRCINTRRDIFLLSMLRMAICGTSVPNSLTGSPSVHMALMQDPGMTVLKSSGPTLQKFLLLIRVDACLDLVDVSINSGNSHDIHDITHTCSEVDEVDGLVQSHLYRTDNLHICIEHL